MLPKKIKVKQNKKGVIQKCKNMIWSQTVKINNMISIINKPRISLPFFRWVIVQRDSLVRAFGKTDVLWTRFHVIY
jgi:hypothetical protein